MPLVIKKKKCHLSRLTNFIQVPDRECVGGGVGGGLGGGEADFPVQAYCFPEFSKFKSQFYILVFTCDPQSQSPKFHFPSDNLPYSFSHFTPFRPFLINKQLFDEHQLKSLNYSRQKRTKNQQLGLYNWKTSY